MSFFVYNITSCTQRTLTCSLQELIFDESQKSMIYVYSKVVIDYLVLKPRTDIARVVPICNKNKNLDKTIYIIWQLAEEIDFLLLFKIRYMAVQGCVFLQTTVFKIVLVAEFGLILLNSSLTVYKKIVHNWQFFGHFGATQVFFNSQPYNFDVTAHKGL